MLATNKDTTEGEKGYYFSKKGIISREKSIVLSSDKENINIFRYNKWSNSNFEWFYEFLKIQISCIFSKKIRKVAQFLEIYLKLNFDINK